MFLQLYFELFRVRKNLFRPGGCDMILKIILVPKGLSPAPFTEAGSVAEYCLVCYQRRAVLSKHRDEPESGISDARMVRNRCTFAGVQRPDATHSAPC